MKTMLPTETIEIWTDGGARGNPGPAGIGVRIVGVQSAETIAELADYIGETTNNQAEYRALVRGLEWLTKKLTIDQHNPKEYTLNLFTDSELMAYQIQGKYKVKNAELKPVYDHIKTMLANYKEYTITPVPRAKNQRADQLVNEALDNALSQAKESYV